MELKHGVRRVCCCGLAWVLAVWLTGCAEQTPSDKAVQPAPPQTEKPSTDTAAAPAEKVSTEVAMQSAPAKQQAVEPSSAGVSPKVPLGLPPLPVPADNPMTAEKVALGELLYFDPRLSKDKNISCATCHDPHMAWAEHEPTSTGIGSQKGGRNSPTVINAAYATSMFWDGRAASLEEQALGPIANPIEMGHTVEAMVADLSGVAVYKDRFQKVFGTGVTQDGVAKAIAAFERTVLSGNSPYDQFMAGNKEALSAAQKHGLEVFENAGCSTCHAPPLMSNYGFQNAGVGMDKEKPDEGRMVVTKKESDRGKFRVPSLRDVAQTAPYFHDGSVDKLEDAVALMAAGGKDNPNLSTILKGVRETRLSEQDRGDLVEFLKGLSGEYPIIEPPKLP
jgi:cytochrome c peroxidase